MLSSTPLTPAVQTKNLGKKYGQREAVVSLDLQIESGQIFGLLGPNGAGKTTAISLLAGVVTPTHGSARIFGHDIQTDAFVARRHIGLVPQELALYQELTARQNLRFFAEVYGLRGKTRDARIDWALELAGLTQSAATPVKTFSGGMKRRLNLVLGLLHQPKLVIMDEPTVGVDPHSRSHIFSAIGQLRDQLGMTVIYTSHYMEEVEMLCSRVAILDHGNLIAHDDVSQLLDAHHADGYRVHVNRKDVHRAEIPSLAASVADIQVKGDTICAPAEALSSVLMHLEKARVVPMRVETNRATLESLFLALTGHELRDNQ